MSPDLQLQSVEYLIFNWIIIKFNWGPQVGILKVTTKIILNYENWIDWDFQRLPCNTYSVEILVNISYKN